MSDSQQRGICAIVLFVSIKVARSESENMYLLIYELLKQCCKGNCTLEGKLRDCLRALVAHVYGKDEFLKLGLMVKLESQIGKKCLEDNFWRYQAKNPFNFNSFSVK
uniref:Uncharacterized protein n=1 Tax=Rhodnius prolixus TaxID=13249 RepID=T1HYD8_RHOPR